MFKRWFAKLFKIFHGLLNPQSLKNAQNDLDNDQETAQRSQNSSPNENDEIHTRETAKTDRNDTGVSTSVEVGRARKTQRPDDERNIQTIDENLDVQDSNERTKTGTCKDFVCSGEETDSKKGANEHSDTDLNLTTNDQNTSPKDSVEDWDKLKEIQRQLDTEQNQRQHHKRNDEGSSKTEGESSVKNSDEGDTSNEIENSANKEVDIHMGENSSKDARTDDFDKKSGKSQRPRNIGNRRYGQTKRVDRGKVNRKSIESRPRLMCRSVGDSWELYLRFNEFTRSEKVFLNGEPIEVSGDEYPVVALTEHLNLEIAGSKNEIKLFAPDKPLIFKLTQRDRRTGMHVKKITSGHFIVIAPVAWKRIGTPFVEDQALRKDDRFRVHHFYREYDSKNEEEQIQAFEQCPNVPQTMPLQIRGTSVLEADGTELYIGENEPTLGTPNPFSVILIGSVEDSTWHEVFDPNDSSLSGVMNGREGRFYIRAYDHNKELADSLEFSYLSKLRGITVDRNEIQNRDLIVPSEDGYDTMQVEFLVSQSTDFEVVPVNPNLHHPSTSTELSVQANHAADLIQCKLNIDGTTNELELKLPRVWWRVTSESNEESIDWNDRPIEMSQADYRDLSAKGSRLEISLPSVVDSCQIGFGENLDKKFPSLKNASMSVGFDEFRYHQEVEHYITEDASLNMSVGEHRSLTLIKIEPDPIPVISNLSIEPSQVKPGDSTRLRWESQNWTGKLTLEGTGIDSILVEANDSLEVKPSMSGEFTLTLDTLRDHQEIKSVTVKVLGQKPILNVLPQVKGALGTWHTGKGYSARELVEAGVSNDYKQLGVPMDKRRRSMHQRNIDNLKNSLNV